tara:strand:- start:641 stop:919 length:279 start_codon:yes stop_codon:yes gene_type:complete
MTKHSKYYYDTDRNLDNAQQGKLIDNKIPLYYRGDMNYEARLVCDNFDLTYHCGTAVTYILRAYRKHNTPIDCLKKAIAHLEFEIEKYEREK